MASPACWLHADRVRFAGPRDIAPLESYCQAPIERLLFDWRWISLFFNRVNTAMGKNPLYPFEISTPVADKLDFVNTVLRQAPKCSPTGAFRENYTNSSSIIAKPTRRVRRRNGRRCSRFSRR